MSAPRGDRFPKEPPAAGPPPSASDLKSGGGGGTLDGMDARVIRLEERTELFAKQFDRIIARLDAMDEKMSKLPTKDFLVGWIVGVFAAALAVAALTFAVADYAAKQAAPEPRPAAAAPAQQQPIVIVLPSAALAPQTPAVGQPAPVPPIAPDAAKP